MSELSSFTHPAHFLASLPERTAYSALTYWKDGAAKRKAEQSLRRRAQAKLLADVAAVRKVAERCEPMVIMLEETAGLRRPRHAALYHRVQAELRSWPYEWRHVESDCAELGAAHHRKRLLWVGVRRGTRAAA